jgi:hypothetical protein
MGLCFFLKKPAFYLFCVAIDDSAIANGERITFIIRVPMIVFVFI